PDRIRPEPSEKMPPRRGFETCFRPEGPKATPEVCHRGCKGTRPSAFRNEAGLLFGERLPCQERAARILDPLFQIVRHCSLKFGCLVWVMVWVMKQAARID